MRGVRSHDLPELGAGDRVDRRDVVDRRRPSGADRPTGLIGEGEPVGGRFGRNRFLQLRLDDAFGAARFTLGLGLSAAQDDAQAVAVRGTSLDQSLSAVFELFGASLAMPQGRIDYSVPIGIGTDSSIKIGAKYLDRHKFNDQNKTDYKAGKEDWLLSQGDVSHIGQTNFYDGMFKIGQRIDYFAAYDYTQAHPNVLKVDATGTLADTLSSDYDVHESIVAGYAMATLKFGGLTPIPGVRMEHTQDRDKAKLVTDTSTLDDDYNSFGKKSYTDWFPGLNAKYEVNKSLLLRAAATTSIGRPNYAQLAPFVLVEDDTVPNITLGNPDLAPYKAVNLDASVEYYLPSQGILSVDCSINTSTTRSTIRSSASPTATMPARPSRLPM